MERLDDLTLDALHEELERAEGNTPTQRLLAAIGRKQGATLAELSERHNVTEKTIRNWLDRFAEQPLSEAPYNEPRSGRPTKLTGAAKEAFLEDLKESPEELGYDSKAWFPGLVRHHLNEEYDVDYSLRHVYRLFGDVGFTHRSGQSHSYKADPEDEA